MLYLLGRRNREFDQLISVIVRAGSESEAREIVYNDNANDDYYKNEWLDPELSDCKEISVNGESEILIYNYWEP